MEVNQKSQELKSQMQPTPAKSSADWQDDYSENKNVTGNLMDHHSGFNTTVCSLYW